MRRRLNVSSVIGAALLLFAFSSIAQVASVGRRVERVDPAAVDSARLLADLKMLSSDEMEGRSADRPSMEKARAFIERRFRESGLAPFGKGYRQEFTIKVRGKESGLPGVNFIGFVKGKKNPEKYIVVSAHYDHVGIEDGQIYNGADDNASGTAALFAIAEGFRKQPPDNSIIVVAFDAEEKGLGGSRYFIENLPVARASVLLNVNMDMVSRNAKGEIYAAGGFHYPHLKPILEKAQKTAKVRLLLGHDDPKLGPGNWTNQSDHAAFHAAKIPFVYFGVEDHADYHKPTDDFEKIDPGFFTRAVETILATVRLLDKYLVDGRR